MSIFRKVKEYLKEPNVVDELCSAIQSFGFDARMTSIYPTVKIVRATERRSNKRASYIYVGEGEHIGAIEISNCPIKWISVLKYKSEFNDSVDYVYILLIPDERVRGASRIHIKTATHRQLPWIGTLTPLKWQSKIRDTGTADMLNNLNSVNRIIMNAINIGTGSDIEVDTENTLGYWLLTVRRAPTSKLWKAYQEIAQDLLKSPLL